MQLPRKIANYDPDQYWKPEERHGFLPRSSPPLLRARRDVPEEVKAVDEIAANLWETNDRDLRLCASGLQSPPPEWLETSKASVAESAFQAYAFLAAALIHRDLLEERTLPACIGSPLQALARRLQRPAALTYSTYVLANTTSTVLARSSPERIEVSRLLTGTADEAWFIACHLSVESTGGQIVAAIESIRQQVGDTDSCELADALRAIASALDWAALALSRVTDNLDPIVFSTVIRPYLFGFTDVKVSQASMPMSYVGETGAQSGAIQAADAGLGVTHSVAVANTLRVFLECAPPPHRSFIWNATEGGRLLAARLTQKLDDPEAYLQALESLHSFRRAHLSVVRTYLEGTGETALGTGGTRFNSWLTTLGKDAEAQATKFRR